MITVDTSQLTEKIRQTMRLLDNAQVQAWGLAAYFLNVIKERTPKDSGETRESWTIHYHKSSDQVTWEISPDGKEDIVTFLEFGTKPHVILPKATIEAVESYGVYVPEGFLAFEIGGETIFAKHVHHPGTKPLGFVRLTRDDLDKSVQEIVDKLHSRISSLWG
jgi:hypothetical protein